MMKRLSPCVMVFCAASGLTFAEAPHATQLELLSDAQAVPCVIGRAPLVSEVLIGTVKAALEANVSVKCKLLELPVDQPLPSNVDLSWITPEGGVVWGLWLGRSIDGHELVVRGLDANSHLQFGMGKATTHNLTQESAVETYVQLAENVLSDYPYLGLADRKAYVAWNLSVAANSPTTCQLQFIKTPPIKRHPFLPVQMSGAKGDAVLGVGHCLQNRIFVDSKEVERALDAGEKLWFKLAHGR